MATWILVAHSAGARIYDEKRGALTLLATIDHPEGLKPGDALVDRPGRVSLGAAGRTSFDAHTDPREAETDRFARMLAERLDAPAGREEFRHLVVVAPPKLLGAIRASLGKNVERRVTEWVSKDWCNLDDYGVAKAWAAREGDNGLATA